MSIGRWDGALIDARIGHARRGDVARQFRYRACYTALPVDPLEAGQLALRPDALGFWRARRQDYGWRDHRSLGDVMRPRLTPAGLQHCRTTLATLSRGPMHGLNPVNFWLARDDEGLRAVLAEVSNTFGEHQLYLCRHADNRVISRNDRLTGSILFHVSPFLPREGRYVFRFDHGPGRFGAWVDWIGPDGDLRLQTALTGPAPARTPASLHRAAFQNALQSFKVTGLIHWQAVRLLARSVRYRRKPRQMNQTRSEVTKKEARDVQ